MQTVYLVPLTHYDVVWAFSSWDAQPSAVLVNQTGNATETYPGTDYRNQAFRTSLGTITVSSGDIVHIEIYRDGTNINDTLADVAYMYAVEFEYTADS